MIRDSRRRMAAMIAGSGQVDDSWRPARNAFVLFPCTRAGGFKRPAIVTSASAQHATPWRKPLKPAV